MSIKVNYQLINLIILFISILSTEVTYLDEDNFEREMTSSNDIWLIEIYSEKCESCRSFESHWEQLIKKLDYLNIGRINIDESKGMNLANKINALENGIPAVKLVFSKDNMVDIMTGTEEPLPGAKTLKKRINKILEEKGKLKDSKKADNEEL